MSQGYEGPRAERDGTRKSVEQGQRTDDWSEDCASGRRSEAARELRTGRGGLERDQQNGEDNNKEEQGDQGNDPSQNNKKDAIRIMKRPAGDVAAPRRELRG